jgi:hypothetical protein
VPIARKHLLPDPLFFRCIFSGRSRRSERHVATRIGAARSESDNLKGWDCDERAALAEVAEVNRPRVLSMRLEGQRLEGVGSLASPER